MKRVMPFILVCLIGFMAGCVAVDQEWVHADKPYKDGTNYHRLVPGHIRWYQYERHSFNLGGKPPALMGGIWYTITTPSDWFWYGPYEMTEKEKFKLYFKKDCPGCKASFDSCIEKINENFKIINDLHGIETEMAIGTKEICWGTIFYIDNNNHLDGDYTTPFEKRFE